jgi:hypothetical protein
MQWNGRISGSVYKTTRDEVISNFRFVFVAVKIPIE